MSLRYQMIQKCNLSENTDNDTRKVIKASCSKCAEWCADNGLNKLTKIEIYGKTRMLQEYSDYLGTKGYSPSTIHTYLYGPCKAMGVHMQEIKKPKRTANVIHRSREADKNKQGKNELEKSDYKRLVSVQRALGLRRAELARIKGKNLTLDESGKLCVEVERGKGGKYHLQRILPQDEDLIRKIFSRVSPEKKLFSISEMKNKIDLHAIRAEQARKAYQYYSSFNTKERGALIEEMKRRWLIYHEGYGKSSIAYKRWCNQLYKNNGLYETRGNNKTRAIQCGRLTCYDRIALMAVSVFHLSHWRLDVTVKNYMI